ncbi:acetamidase/formamidase family protein [Candidatus Palauibacter sp.]|uniref:acetamidase/formamidase family protein n=1 Tax=Candidatus Palauibacter sp. TaxID=3101350 RepID=UPI003B02A57B
MRPAPRLAAGIPALALAVTTFALLTGCAPGDAPGGGGEPAAADAAAESGAETPTPQHTLTADQTHNRWSRTIPPILTVEPGAVIEAYLEEASDQQLTRESTVEDLATLSFDPIHPLTGPVYVEGAEPGDLLAVTLHEIELGDWGWVANVPGFGFLSDQFPDPYLRIFEFEPGDTSVGFAPGIRIPLRPFPGVMGVAPDTDSMLVTIPPRQNGGNMDDRDLVEGTTVYFPVLVEGALFSIGDPHIAQGDGEVGGTAIEGPLRVVYELDVIEGAGPIPSPHYETDEFYAVTGFAPTIDEAARNAVQAMVDYLVSSRDLSRQEAYQLASMAGDLKISEVVDVPNMLVAMRISKDVFGN